MRSTGIILSVSLLLGGEGFSADQAIGHPPRPEGTVTFNRDVAPILFRNCAGCHRPDQSSPFDLLTYQDARKRGRMIVDAVTTRLMPPWPPAPGPVRLEGEKRLTAADVGLIQQWVDEGMIEGDPDDLPPVPDGPDRWELGTPDLVLKVDGEFVLPPDGSDLYWNFVVPAANRERRFVRAFELLPGSKAVHHATVFLNENGLARQLDVQEAGPGFSGMDMPAGVYSPQGHFLSWQPGARAYESKKGFAWVLPPGTDFVLQLHLNPTGKPERIQPEIGLYFTEEPPTNVMHKVQLADMAIDIPPGETNYVVKKSYAFPVDAELHGISPHAHFLCREMRVTATFPDGRELPLISIPHWDFFWQGVYPLTTPLKLPKGTRITMNYRYDNSTGNPANPNNPPKRVRYGAESHDEMGEFWMQVVVSPDDLPVLQSDYAAKTLPNTIDSLKYRIRMNPRDPAAITRLGLAQMQTGNTNEALHCFEEAAALSPESPEAEYLLGRFFLSTGDYRKARIHLERTVQLDPSHLAACSGMGMVAYREGALEESVVWFKRVLELDPGNTNALRSLENLSARINDSSE